jgi:PKD domain
MKRILYLSIVLTIFLFSCESTPEASFSVTPSIPEVGQEVFFYNNSNNAESFEWDFGDGYISNEADPIHIFSANGSFEVILTAISKKGLESKASVIVDVLIPTLLEIEVREWDQLYAVSNASVILYPSEFDWVEQTDYVYEGITDFYGLVVFSGLDESDYWVDVWEQNHDNYTLYSDDIEFVHTPALIPNQINRFVAWVDYVEHSKGTDRGSREMVIKKLERKAIDRSQPEADGSTENWQEIYNRRSNK